MHPYGPQGSSDVYMDSGEMLLYIHTQRQQAIKHPRLKPWHGLHSCHAVSNWMFCSERSRQGTWCSPAIPQEAEFPLYYSSFVSWLFISPPTSLWASELSHFSLSLTMFALWKEATVQRGSLLVVPQTAYRKMDRFLLGIFMKLVDFGLLDPLRQSIPQSYISFPFAVHSRGGRGRSLGQWCIISFLRKIQELY